MFDFMSTNMTIFHGFGMSVFWIIVIFLIFSCFNSNKCEGKKENPIEILKRKFANGEITEEEFINRKKILEENI